MAYFPPYIDSSGLHVPAYVDILADLIAQAQSIYGSDIYLGNDSADYQMLSVFALKQNDTLQALQLIYNNRGPGTAIGSALDSIVKQNGLARKAASYSTCVVVITGTPATIISNGIVQDLAGNKWDLPSLITIGANGTVTITATCETMGAVTAMVGDLNIISTPTAGWINVTNSVAAIPGQPVEADSALRARQAISSALPSSTMNYGTIAALLSLPGVTRLNFLENPTSSASDGSTIYGYPAGTPLPAGLPAHSITCVVEGDTDLDVVQTIYNNRGQGCATNGTSSGVATDPNTGNTMTINFYRPTYSQVYATLNIHALPGYTTATTVAIQAAVLAYLNSLQIGENVSWAAIASAAFSVTSISRPLFTIPSFYIGTAASPTGTADIAIPFNVAAQSVAANIVVNQV